MHSVRHAPPAWRCLHLAPANGSLPPIFGASSGLQEITEVLVAIGPSSFAQADETPLEMLRAAGCEIRPNPFGRRLTEDEIIEQLKDVDGLVAGLEPLNAKVIGAAAPKLKAIARVGIGVANVDFDAAAAHDVKVSNTPEGPTRAVAEMTLAAALHFARKLVPMNAAIHAGDWKKVISPGLDGANVLFVGYGRIGRRTAGLFRAFGAKILVHDPFLESADLVECETRVDLDEGLRQADVISLHASGEDPVLADDQFAVMKEGAILLNSARGELIVEQALIRALDAQKLGGVWIDAFWQEPYSGPLAGKVGVLMTPHASTYTSRCRLDMESQAVDNLLRDLGLGAS